MRILYGVVGEGMGHATRSRVVLEHLAASGHQIKVVVSGKAHGYLVKAMADKPNVTIEEIGGLEMRFEGGEMDLSRTLAANLERLPGNLLKNLKVYRKVAEDAFAPELVVSDFESWAYLYGINHRIPVISLDNMQVLNRCKHDLDATDLNSMSFKLAKYFVKFKLPWAYHYLVTSFFFPPVRKKKTTLVPPILRPSILNARREPGQHVLVYHRPEAVQELLPALKRLPFEFRIYGTGKEGQDGNINLRPFSDQGFVDDLRTARALVAGAGFSLMGEAVHLRVPMLAVPLRGQYEQVLNGRYLEKLGYGRCDEAPGEEALSAFLSGLDRHTEALGDYEPHGNDLLLGCVDELLKAISLDEPPLVRLESPALGKYDGPPLSDDEP